MTAAKGLPGSARPVRHIGRTLSADDFKAAFRRQPGGVAVVTADDGTGPVALTATSVFSVSVEPNLLVFSISDLSSSASVLRNADSVVVHLLEADNIDLAMLGSTHGADRFADTNRWARLTTGEPLYHEVRTWIRGRVINRFPTGTATVIVVEGDQISLGEEEVSTAPLVYHNRTWHQLDGSSQLSS